MKLGRLLLVSLVAQAATQVPPLAPFETAAVPAGVRTLDALPGPTPATDDGRPRAELGLHFAGPRLRGMELHTVLPGSPAANAGLLAGDIVLTIGRVHVRDSEDLDVALGELRIGQKLTLTAKRPGVRREVTLELAASETTGAPGFEVRRTKGTFEVTSVKPGSAAARAGLRAGDMFSRVDDIHMASSSALRKHLERKRKFKLLLQRAETQLSVDLTAAEAPREARVDWRGKDFQLAVLLVEFTDVKHDARYAATDFARMLFSTGEYAQSPDGRPTYGSMRDYYREVSYRQFDLDGKVFDWVQVPHPWAYYDAQDMGAGDGSTSTVFADALRAVRRRHGNDCLDKFAGVVFLYAGERRSLRGSQLWPHRASVPVGDRYVPYYITEEGGARFNSIGVHCHEFGHMLGLPDFYGYGHRTGVGKFCTMAIGHLGAEPSLADRPFHICAYCKVWLGWAQPKIVPPTPLTKLALRGIETRSGEVLKVPLTADEYYLLEVRNKVGFDTDFFRDGLLIWHVGEDGARERGQIAVPIDLEEAHGKRYFDASLREESSVPFPWGLADVFTPFSVPSSASKLPGAAEVAITDIRVYRPATPPREGELPAGTVFFTLGDLTAVRKIQMAEPAQPEYPTAAPVTELDPVTKLPVPFTVGPDNVAAPGPNIMPRPKR